MTKKNKHLVETHKEKEKKEGGFVGGEKQEDKRDDDR